MAFIHSFGGAKMVLRSIKKGTCAGKCRSGWLKNIKYAIKSPTNPLKLSKEQKKELNNMIKDLSGKRIKPAEKRPSPSESATLYCGKRKKGNDGNMYISKRDKNGVCRWSKIKK
jgi:hypothetical protein